MTRPIPSQYVERPLPADADEVAILRRAAAIYEQHGDRSEPGRLVPAWLRGCAHVLAEQRRIPTAEELAAREEWDRLKLAEARHA